ncbi:hypothetical protein KP509_25G033000 [Ceratopteris richardii]|uniref:Uncharacterized protein n=1 Tax=Ceratopteris richardii TaxID=49495 RepID=A0A8T2RR35_CERRI|nr:hypothetical protein KP509_25G033000 [Ceratopteris richardii]
MMLKAYQARIQEGPNVTDHDKCYPRADLEIERTKLCAKMVALAHTMFEASRLFNYSGSAKTQLHLDGLLEKLEGIIARSAKEEKNQERDKHDPSPPKAYVPNSTEPENPSSLERIENLIAQSQKEPAPRHHDKASERPGLPTQKAYVPEAYVPNSTEPDTSSSMNQYTPEFLREIQEEKWAKESEVPPPIELVDDTNDQFPQDLPSIYGEKESAQSQERLDFESNSLQELPHFTGPWEAKSTCMRAPTVMVRNEDSVIPRNTEVVKNTKVQCNLTLEELLKVRPEVWKHVANQVPEIAKPRSQVGSQREVPEIPLDKIGDMSEGEEGNTYLPITHQGYTTKAILDSGAGVAIVTTSLWKRWGKPALRPTRMKLQMADGHIERPFGLLEGITLTTCGVEFEHTFAICDFSKNQAYEMILERPFMRKLQVVQDWGTNSLYLQHLGVTTKVNLKDYSHRDVPPIQWNPIHRAKDDTESVHSLGSGSLWMHEDTHLWMCKVAVEEEKREKAREIGAKETHRSIQDPAYATVVFPD